MERQHRPRRPKKAVGILNNHLYVGRLVWNRRQWRRNPESEQRERRYWLRDPSERVEVAVPDLRIIDQPLWDAVQDQLKARQKPRTAIVDQRKPKHLLSGLIKCSVCGANYVVAGGITTSAPRPKSGARAITPSRSVVRSSSRLCLQHCSPAF